MLGIVSYNILMGCESIKPPLSNNHLRTITCCKNAPQQQMVSSLRQKRTLETYTLTKTDSPTKTDSHDRIPHQLHILSPIPCLKCL